MTSRPVSMIKDDEVRGGKEVTDPEGKGAARRGLLWSP